MQIIHTGGGGTIFEKKKKKKVGGGFVAQLIAEESKHSTGADLCGLSLVREKRASGFERLDSKVGVVRCQTGGGVMAQVCGLRSFRFKSRSLKGASRRTEFAQECRLVGEVKIINKKGIV